MATIIQDGTGTGNKLKVDANNRIKVDAITEERAVFNSIEEGNTFIITSDFITAPSGSETGLLYVENTSDKDMLIHHIKLWTGTTSTTSEIRVYRNPTTGTLISSASAADVNNLNFGSANAYEGLAYQGNGVDATITDGSIIGRHYVGVGNQQMIAFMWNGAMSLPKNKTCAVSVTPQVSLSVTAEIEAYFE